MPRLFFDLHDGSWDRGQTGTEMSGIAEVIKQAKHTLPAMALDDLPRGGDRHTTTVLVADEDGRPVYTATLTYSELVLAR